MFNFNHFTRNSAFLFSRKALSPSFAFSLDKTPLNKYLSTRDPTLSAVSSACFTACFPTISAYKDF